MYSEKTFIKSKLASEKGYPNTRIDHVIDSKWKNSLLDVKCEQDQMLRVIITADGNASTKPKRAEGRARRINAAKLRNSRIKAAFQLELRNRFPTLEEEWIEHGT